MSNTIDVKCAVCGEIIKYDGKMTSCPHCFMEFESDEISGWKKQLASLRVTETKSEETDTPPTVTEQPLDSHLTHDTPKENSGPRIMPKAAPKAMPPSVKRTSADASARPRPFTVTSSKESNTTIYEWRGKRYCVGQEKDAFLFILKNGYISEVIDESNGVTDKARRLLDSMGKRVPDLSAFNRERRFFEIMYGVVFAGEDLPLYVKDVSTGAPMASNRAQLLHRIEHNSYSGAIFELCGKRMTLAELAQSEVLCAYLRLEDSSPWTLCKCFEPSGKRLSIDENYVCVDLGGDADICRRDALFFTRYKYYLENGQPCDGFNENASFDAEFLRAYSGYAEGGVREYMQAYFYLLSVAYNRSDVCEVFGSRYTASSMVPLLKAAAEEAAEQNARAKFLLLRQLLIHKVFGEYNGLYEKTVANASTAEQALFEAYYSLTKQKKLLYFDGKYQTAESIARKISERGRVGNILDDTGNMSFLSSVSRCTNVDVQRIRTEIENGINNILGEIR